MAQQSAQVTMVRAWVPGMLPGAESQRIVFTVVLDAQGQPDAAAWQADPAVWPARFERPDRPPRLGDLQHDGTGWWLAFATGDGKDPEAAPWRLMNHGGGFRPGEVVSLRAPDGAEAAWRIVGVA